MTQGSGRKTAAFKGCLRGLGWLSSLASILIQGFIIDQWPQLAGPVGAGLVGSCISAISDSWELLSAAGHARGFVGFSPVRLIVHDLAALVLCLAGVILMLFTGSGLDGLGYESLPAFESSSSSGGGGNDDKVLLSRSNMMNASTWSLVTVLLWRLVFLSWGGWDVAKDLRMSDGRLRRHSYPSMAEA